MLVPPYDTVLVSRPLHSGTPTEAIACIYIAHTADVQVGAAIYHGEPAGVTQYERQRERRRGISHPDAT